MSLSIKNFTPTLDYFVAKEVLKDNTEDGFIINDGDKKETYYELVSLDKKAAYVWNPTSMQAHEVNVPSFGKIFITLVRVPKPEEFAEGKFFIVHKDDINGYFK